MEKIFALIDGPKGFELRSIGSVEEREEEIDRCTLIENEEGVSIPLCFSESELRGLLPQINAVLIES